MTLNIELSSASLHLLISLVSFSEITLICFDFLDFSVAGRKIFSMFQRLPKSDKYQNYFQRLIHNHGLVPSSLMDFFF